MATDKRQVTIYLPDEALDKVKSFCRNQGYIRNKNEPMLATGIQAIVEDFLGISPLRINTLPNTLPIQTIDEIVNHAMRIESMPNSGCQINVMLEHEKRELLKRKAHGEGKNVNQLVNNWIDDYLEKTPTTQTTLRNEDVIAFMKQIAIELKKEVLDVIDERMKQLSEESSKKELQKMLTSIIKSIEE